LGSLLSFDGGQHRGFCGFEIAVVVVAVQADHALERARLGLGLGNVAAKKLDALAVEGGPVGLGRPFDGDLPLLRRQKRAGRRLRRRSL
jgi:hypothetical protein